MHTEKQTNKHHILSHTRIHSKWNASVYVYMRRISYINCPITGRVMFMLSSRALYGQPLHRRPLKCVPGGRRLLLRVGKAFLFTCTYFMHKYQGIPVCCGDLVHAKENFLISTCGYCYGSYARAHTHKVNLTFN